MQHMVDSGYVLLILVYAGKPKSYRLDLGGDDAFLSTRHLYGS